MDHFLRKVPLFSSLTAAECQQVEARLKKVDFPPQSTIVREGTAGDTMYFVLEGLVAVRKRDVSTGIEFELTQLGAGQAFGEMALLTGQPRSATVVALQPTTCATLGQTELQTLLTHRPRIALALTATLAERLDRANQRVGIDFLSLSKAQVDPRVLKLLPITVMAQQQVVPVAFANNRLTLAMVNPANVLAFDDVRRVLKGIMIEPVAITEEDFRKFLTSTVQPLLDKEKEEKNKDKPKPDAPAPRRQAAAGATSAGATSTAPSYAEVIDLLQSELIRELQMVDDTDATAGSATDLMSASTEAPIVRLANSILGLAIQQGSSDIHIEPMEQDVTVRFRVDGALQVVQQLPKKVQLGLVSRMKILSKLDIAEKRLPQDGASA